jgi:hypothetical protein
MSGTAIIARANTRSIAPGLLLIRRCFERSGRNGTPVRNSLSARSRLLTSSACTKNRRDVAFTAALASSRGLKWTTISHCPAEAPTSQATSCLRAGPAIGPKGASFLTRLCDATFGVPQGAFPCASPPPAKAKKPRKAALWTSHLTATGRMDNCTQDAGEWRLAAECTFSGAVILFRSANPFVWFPAAILAHHALEQVLKSALIREGYAIARGKPQDGCVWGHSLVELAQLLASKRQDFPCQFSTTLEFLMPFLASCDIHKPSRGSLSWGRRKGSFSPG